uniref:helix-turn-helix domain-containing protein n=1 Tax=Glutamicibacter creatinolyticus TaxID=162496 RepID=UPI0032167AF7
MDELPNQPPRIEHWLQPAALALLVAIEDRGSLSAGARAVGMAQPNASRALHTLE